MCVNVYIDVYSTLDVRLTLCFLEIKPAYFEVKLASAGPDSANSADHRYHSNLASIHQCSTFLIILIISRYTRC